MDSTKESGTIMKRIYGFMWGLYRGLHRVYIRIQAPILRGTFGPWGFLEVQG